MKAMILAAGKGERMRPLTDKLPKPMLQVGGKPLIVYHIERLAKAGVSDIVINIAYLGEKIKQALGGGAQWGVSIRYSEEPEPLETAGALLHAMPLLGGEPFVVINGDVWTDFPLENLLVRPLAGDWARLVFVENPEHNKEGDFSLSDTLPFKRVLQKDESMSSYTFSGMALFSPEFITDYPQCRKIFPLKEVFDYGIRQQRIGGIVHGGQWWDVGTPQRLSELDALLV